MCKWYMSRLIAIEPTGCVSSSSISDIMSDDVVTKGVTDAE